MTIVEYTPDQWDDLQTAVAQMKGKINLSHRPFVNYYYATNPTCKLYLYRDDDGRVLGTHGRELLPFVYNGRAITVRFGSNWYSLRRGIGRELINFTKQANPGSIGAGLGGSDDTISIAHHYDWVMVAGIKVYTRNGDLLPRLGEAGWKSGLRKIRGSIRYAFSSSGKRGASLRHTDISVEEQREISSDLLPRSSPFAFRFAPGVEYLAWRYNTSLSFVRYRLFAIKSSGVAAGYVILNDSPECILVAQCDGENPESLAYGIILAVDQLERENPKRAVYLTCCVPQMQAILEGAGFRTRKSNDVPFIIRREQWPFEPAPNSASWLINSDWGDRGLRSPFLDEPR